MLFSKVLWFVFIPVGALGSFSGLCMINPPLLLTAGESSVQAKDVTYAARHPVLGELTLTVAFTAHPKRTAK
jgi:hypothetical protein